MSHRATAKLQTEPARIALPESGVGQVFGASASGRFSIKLMTQSGCSLGSPGFQAPKRDWYRASQVYLARRPFRGKPRRRRRPDQVGSLVDERHKLETVGRPARRLIELDWPITKTKSISSSLKLV